MPLILSTSEGSYLWPVKVDVPIDGGGHDTLAFKARLRRLDQERIEQLTTAAVKRVKALQNGDDTDAGVDDREIAQEIVIGWEDIKDDAGEQVEYSTAAKEQLLKFPGAATAIVLAWYDSINGKRTKN